MLGREHEPELVLERVPRTDDIQAAAEAWRTEARGPLAPAPAFSPPEWRKAAGKNELVHHGSPRYERDGIGQRQRRRYG